jgi:hypothetical protein
MRFDPSGLYAGFDRLREAAAAKGKDLADVQAADFIKEERDQGRKIAPTADELTSKAISLKWHLKRKPGVTPAKELARRIRARGTFGKGWRIQKITSEKFRIRIWLVNTSGESEKVDEAHKTSDRAEKITGKRFRDRLEKMASQTMGVF